MNPSHKSISVPLTLICAIGLGLLFTGCTATSIDGMRRPAVERIGGYPDRAANELNLPYRKRVDELFKNGGQLNSELNTRSMARDGGGVLESQAVQRNIDNLKEEQAFLKRKIADMNRQADDVSSTIPGEVQAVSEANSVLRRQLESQSLQIDSLKNQIGQLNALMSDRLADQGGGSYGGNSGNSGNNYNQSYQGDSYNSYSSPPPQTYTQSQPAYDPPVYEAPYRVPKAAPVYQPPAPVYQPPAPVYQPPAVVEVPEVIYEEPTVVHSPPVYREPEPLYAPQVEVTPPRRATQPSTVVSPKEVSRPSRHKVRPGEYLSTIASRYSVSMPDILAANPEIDPNRLRVGQLIKIP